MIRHTFKVILRNLVRNKGFNTINILGLAVGLVSFLLIALWIQDELSYDKFHENAERIYRIGWYSENSQTRTPHPMTYTMVDDFSEVENAVSISPVWGEGLTQPERTIKYGEVQFEESGIYSADTTFFQVFSFPLLKGDPKIALKDIGSIVISETAAKKIFGKEDPLNKMITINFQGEFTFKVSGVMKDIPANSHFHFNFLISYVTMKAFETGNYYEWSDFGHYNYLLLRPGVNSDDLEQKMISWSGKYIDWSEGALGALERGEMKFILQPLQDIHLKSKLKWELEANGDILYIYIFASMGILVLVIACINFMNLSIARSSIRFKEIGVKKVIGAQRSLIQMQFIAESFFSATIAMILSLVIFEIIAIPAGNLTGKSFVIQYSNPFVILSLMGLVAICGLIAGLYPAVYMSGFSPFLALKGTKSIGNKKPVLRNALMVFQFSVSIFLIIATLSVSRQVGFLRSHKLGFESEQLLVVPIKDTLMQKNYESVKAQLLTNHNIKNISAVSNVPGHRFNQNPIQWPAMEDQFSASELKVDPDFLNTLNITLDTGRFFSKDRLSDIENAFILNETAAKLFDWKSPLDKELIWYDDETNRRGEVIGVISDFHFQSLHSGIEPLIIHFQPDDLNYFIIKIENQNIHTTLEFIKQKYERLDPQHAFSFYFMDDEIDKLYQSEEQMQEVVGYFTILAIIISCIGLFGLSSFTVEQRTKEIGIRKVNGASMSIILLMLLREFSKWIIISAIIATPITWLILHDWLQNFSFKTSGLWVFYPLAFLLTLLVAWLTIGPQSIKAARKNPVDSLRYE